MQATSPEIYVTVARRCRKLASIVGNQIEEA
jgi:hypothetical protein